MNRLLGLCVAGLIITCGVDTERDVREVHQVVGTIMYDRGCLYFNDTKGLGEEACQVPCVITTGELPPAGSDLREPTPTVPAEHEDTTGRL